MIEQVRCAARQRYEFYVEVGCVVAKAQRTKISTQNIKQVRCAARRRTLRILS